MLKNINNKFKMSYKEQFDLHKTDLKRSWNIIKKHIWKGG